MLSDYTDRDFRGKIYFSKLNSGAVLGVGESGLVEAINISTNQHQEFIQSEPSSEWIFNHDFGVAPIVVVFREDGKDITDAVEVYTDEVIVKVKTEDILLTGTVIAYTVAFSAQNNNNSALGLRWFIQDSFTNLECNAGYTIVESELEIVELKLPSIAQPGNYVQIIGENYWRVTQNLGQSIRFGNQLSTEGSNGYLESTDIGACVTLTCSRTNNAWSVTSSQGNLRIV